jgi:hypothetical protein
LVGFPLTVFGRISGLVHATFLHDDIQTSFCFAVHYYSTQYLLQCVFTDSILCTSVWHGNENTVHIPSLTVDMLTYSLSRDASQHWNLETLSPHLT